MNGDDRPWLPPNPERFGADQHDELYTALVRLCQEYGTTTSATYELLHSAVDTITANDDAPRERTVLSLRWSEADLRIAWAACTDRDDDPDGTTMPTEVLAGMHGCARRIEDRISGLGGEVISDYLTAELWRD